MLAASRSRLSSLAVGGLVAALVAALPLGQLTAPAQAAPAGANPTGTAAGSLANGVGYPSVGLSTTADGQVRVTWKRPGPASRFQGFDVRVGINWRMDAKVRRYSVSRKTQSLVVPPAFGASRSSGNFSFVKVVVRRSNGTRGVSPAKWIQTPLAAGCPSGRDRATIGTFNVRTWGTDVARGDRRFNWKVRGPRVVKQILRSGAHAVAIQEASGRGGTGNGKKRQPGWLLARLNATDPDRSARWVDALPRDAYRGDGRVGTRVFFDASKYDKLGFGFTRIPDPHASTAYAPWARLQDVNRATSPFVLVSTHLANGEGRRAFRARGREVTKVVDLVTRLHSANGDQVILAGDLNSTVNTKPYNSVHRALLRAGFYDAFASARLVRSNFPTTNSLAFPVRRTPHRRDYILTYGGTPGSCRYVNHAYRRASQAASDHFLQTATVPVSSD